MFNYSEISGEHVEREPERRAHRRNIDSLFAVRDREKHIELLQIMQRHFRDFFFASSLCSLAFHSEIAKTIGFFFFASSLFFLSFHS